MNPENEEVTRLKKEMARLHAELDERSTEVELLHRILRAASSAPGLQELLDFVSRLAVEATETDFSTLYLLDREKGELVLSAASDSVPGAVGRIKMHVSEGITGWVAREGEPVALDKEAYNDPRFKYFPQLRDEGYQSILSVPMVSKDEVIGVINVKTFSPHRYTEKQMRLLAAIAGQATAVIEGAQIEEMMRRRASEISAISEVSKTITSNLYLEEILQLIVAVTAKSLNFKICSIMLLDPDKQELVIKATQSKSREYIRKPNLKVGESIAGRAVLEGKPVTVLDVTQTPGYRYPDIAEREGLRSLISVPLSVKDEIIGVLNCYKDRHHIFNEEEKALLISVANQAAIAIVNAKLMVKSAIIQEMHHRVKNNLQTIASLLRLQMHHYENPTVTEVLQESINRILSIAAVHDILSREDLDLISVNQVTETILEHTRQSIIKPQMQVEMGVEGAEILLPSSQATSMALILNELLQNAVEHGFEDRDTGKIQIKFERTAGRIRVEVVNDGAPLPPDFDVHSNNTLGLQIVQSLVREDLGGQFSIASENGLTTVNIDFPDVSKS